MESVLLSNGVKLPQMGFGCYALGEERPKEILLEAIAAGYRHFDTASFYQTEEVLGEAIRESGVPREEFVLTTKLWRTEMDDPQAAFERSRKKLGTGYLDLYLIHWPRPDLQRADWRELDARVWGFLEDLYQRGYVLVDIHQLAAEDRDGNLVQGSFPLKEGQTPFVLSLRDFTLAQEEDPLVNCLEAFLKEHRDFSYKKARGLLGLSKGFAGDLGEEERKEALEDLKDRGWSLASCGYEDVSYGSELSLVQEDAEQWKTQVEPYAGETDVLIFPEQTDLGSWSSYGTEDPKYTYLRGLGFRYFCVEDANPSFVQVGEDFVHQGIREIDSYQEYTELMQ